ncbi:hypothetical protein FRC11_005292, partial [Ceratobasidium sp. 423]
MQDKDNVPDLEAFSAEINEHMPGPITRPLLVAEEAAATQLPTKNAEIIEIQGPIGNKPSDINKADSPKQEAADGLRRSSRNCKPVEKLVVSHAPMHKRGLPKWKTDKMKKAEEAIMKWKISAAKKGNSREKSNDFGANKDKDGTKENESNETPETCIEPTDGAGTKDSVAEVKQTNIPITKMFYDPAPSTIEEIKGRYGEDKFYKFIIDNPSHFKKFKVIDGLVYIKESEGKALCIPDLEVDGKKL